jgi:hypothetical protein
MRLLTKSECALLMLCVCASGGTVCFIGTVRVRVRGPAWLCGRGGGRQRYSDRGPTETTLNSPATAQ